MLNEPSNVSPKDYFAMALALFEADQAAQAGDVPVGCVILDQSGKVLARARNERELRGDPTAHAEIIALRQAALEIGYWRLLDTTLYVTLEPCPMCAGALVNARVSHVFWAADDPKWGGMRSQYSIGSDGKLNHELTFQGGLLADHSVRMLRRFFSERRKTKAIRDKLLTHRG